MTLPSYYCAAYREQAPLWAYLDDVFNGSEAWLHRDISGKVRSNDRSRIYLPQEPAEDNRDYESRLARSPFTENFATAIRDFVGMVLANGLDTGDLPFLNWANLDAAETPGNQLVAQIAMAAMCRGHTFIWVDAPPPDSTIRSQADLLASGRTPHWVHVEAPDVLSWHHQNGTLQRVIFRERRLVPAGMYGEELRTYYRILTPGQWSLVELVRSGNTWAVVEHDSGITSVGYIPFVPVYAGLKTGSFRSKPPLKPLANLNITHYQVKSDHLQKIHKCCMPIPTIRDAMSQQSEYVLGPNTLLKIQDPNGGFAWQEPDASSIEQSRREVMDLEEAMDFLGAAYLSKPSDRQAAATTYLVAARVESSLELFASDLSAGLTRAIEMSADYMAVKRRGRKIMLSGKLTLSGRITKPKPDPQLLLAYLRLLELNVIDAEKLLILLMSEGLLPDSMGIIEGHLENGGLSQTKNEAL